MRIPTLLTILSYMLATLQMQAQLLPNGGFEIDDVAPIGKPDFFRYRIDSLQGIEYDTVRTGNQCALFNYTGVGEKAAYYYAGYDASGSSFNFPNVRTGQVYELSFYYRTSMDFVGNGLHSQLLFVNDADEFIGNVAIEPARTSPGKWSRMSITGVITGSVTKITAGIYYNGHGKAWVDDMELRLIREPLGDNLGFEIDNAAPFGLPDHYFSRTIGGVTHSLETNAEQSYLGQGAVKFDNQTDQSSAGYFYGMYNEGSSVRELLDVYPGDSYRLTGYTRVDSSFTGNGSYLSGLFFDENGAFVDRQNSSYQLNTTWTKVDMELHVPQEASGMLHAVEYKGKGTAYVDHLSLDRANLVVNSSFEKNKVIPYDKADRWKSRFGAEDSIAGIETDSLLVFSGKQSARFNSSEQALSYYYGPYNASGSLAERIGVEKGQVFQMSAFSKVSPTFSGKGVRMSLIFWTGNSFHSRVDSPRLLAPEWTEHVFEGEVPEGADAMSYSIEYDGRGTAWFDDVSVRNLYARWYEKEAALDEFDTLSYAGGDKVDFSIMEDHFYDMHNTMETHYNGNGTWGNGYACWPLIRSTANAASAYINAYELICDPIFLTRAYEALEYLVADQEESGAFKWYNDKINCGEGSLSTGAVMYEGGIATVALMEGYAQSGDTMYLHAATKFCDFMKYRPPNANANFTGFALWAFAENYKVTNDPGLLESCLIYFESLHSFQLPSGMWSDTHNQHIWYHGIIARGLVNLLSIMPDSHPKTEVVRHATFKAINHIIRSLRPGGRSISFPGEPVTTNTGFTMDPLIMAWDYMGYTDLEDQLNELTHGAQNLPASHVQAHRFASFGRIFRLYYTSDLPDLSLDLTGVESGAADYEANRPIHSIQTISETAQVDYDSAWEIQLSPGFEILQGGQLEAFIDGCDRGGGGQH